MNWVAGKMKHLVPSLLTGAALLLAVNAAASSNGPGSNNKDSAKTESTATASHTALDDAMRMEGERAFHANCGRCHVAPPKFSPRMVATIVRHMRVRATITDQEMRAILHYMSE